MTRVAVLLLLIGLVCGTVGFSLWLGQPALIVCLLVIGAAALSLSGVLLLQDMPDTTQGRDDE